MLRTTRQIAPHTRKLPITNYVTPSSPAPYSPPRRAMIHNCTSSTSFRTCCSTANCFLVSPNTHAFLCFHRDQQDMITMALKFFLSLAVHLLVSLCHQTCNSSCSVGVIAGI